MRARIAAKGLVCIAVASLVSVGYVWAQAAPEPVVPAAAQPEPDGITLKFDNAPLDMLLHDYGVRTGKTLLLSPAVPKATVTLRSQGHVSAAECLRLIEQTLAMNGIALIDVDEKTLKVVPIAQAQQETIEILAQGADVSKKPLRGVVTRLVPLKHIELAEAMHVIQPLMHPYGQVQVIDRINSLLVTDTQDNLTRIMSLIELVDQPIGPRAEVHVISIRHAQASHVKELLDEVDDNLPPKPPSAVAATVSASPTIPGVIRAPRAPGATPASPDPSLSASAAILKHPVKIVADDRTNVLIIITPRENMPVFEQIVQVLDVQVEKKQWRHLPCCLVGPTWIRSQKPPPES